MGATNTEIPPFTILVKECRFLPHPHPHLPPLSLYPPFQCYLFPLGGGYSNIRAWWRHATQQGMVFGDFCLRGHQFYHSNKQGTFSWQMPWTGYDFGVRCLKQGKKIDDFCLKGEVHSKKSWVAPPHPRICRAPLPPTPPKGT